MKIKLGHENKMKVKSYFFYFEQTRTHLFKKAHARFLCNFSTLFALWGGRGPAGPMINVFICEQCLRVCLAPVDDIWRNCLVLEFLRNVIISSVSSWPYKHFKGTCAFKNNFNWYPKFTFN